MNTRRKPVSKRGARNRPSGFRPQSSLQTGAQKAPEAVPDEDAGLPVKCWEHRPWRQPYVSFLQHKRVEGLRELLGRPSSLGRNTCYSLDEAIAKMARKLDDAEEVPIILKKAESSRQIAKLFKLLVCKMIFQGKIDCGIINSEEMISPLWGMNICYDDFCKKMNNLACIPLDSLSIYYEKDRVYDNFEDIFAEFLKHLNVKCKQCCGAIFSLPSESHPVLLGDCINIMECARRTTRLVRIAEHCQDRHIQLVIIDGKKTLFFCRNQKGYVVALPLSMQFCMSFSELLDAYDPSLQVYNNIPKKEFSTLSGMAGEIFLLFLASHGISEYVFFSGKNNKTVFDDYSEFVTRKCDDMIEYFVRYIFLDKHSFDLFLDEFNLEYICSYCKKPMAPFVFKCKGDHAADKEAEAKYKIETLRKLLANESIRKSRDDTLIIKAELDRVIAPIEYEKFYCKHVGTVLKENNNDSAEKFVGRFNYRLKKILNKNGIFDYKITGSYKDRSAKK